MNNNKKNIYFLKQTINYGIKNSNVLRSQPALSEHPRVQVKTLKKLKQSCSNSKFFVFMASDKKD